MNRIALLLIAYLLVYCSTNSDVSTPNRGKASGSAVVQPTSFEVLDGDKTGLTASNTLLENNLFNHFRWLAFYNGSGICVADFNNDGLPDVYVGINMGQDRLFFNRGDFHFEDVSHLLPPDKAWTTGISVVDINNDGWLDIYVCKSGPYLKPTERKNLLLINQKGKRFVDRAEAYGIAHGGWSIQAAFFDADKDGDLDMYLANQAPDPRLKGKLHISTSDSTQLYSDVFYLRNADGTFTNASEAFGIQNFAHALNVTVADFNEDGWLDVFVANDYLKPDYLYINHQGKFFRDELQERLMHISYFSMGSDAADINNDGHIDFSVLDMSAADHYRNKTNMGAMNVKAFWDNVAKGNFYQYMFNTLQLHQGSGYFSDIGHMAKIAQTDWSWSVLIEDFNMDGKKDIYITNGIKRDIRNNDFLQKLRRLSTQGKSTFNPMDFVREIPSTPLSNYYFANINGYHFADHTRASGCYRPDFSQGAAKADFDGDLDYDLVLNVMDKPTTILKNNSPHHSRILAYRLHPSLWTEFINAVFVVQTAEHIYRWDFIPVRGYFSSSWNDILLSIPEGEIVRHAFVATIYGDTFQLPLQWNQRVVLHKRELQKFQPSTTTPRPYFESVDLLSYRHRENATDDYRLQVLLPHKLSEEGPVVRYYPDGNELYIGGSAGHPLRQYRWVGHRWEEVNASFWRQFAHGENRDIVFFDKDGDGDLDMYLVNGGNEIDYPNDLWQRDLLFERRGSNWVLDTSLPSLSANNSTAIPMDIDRDGDQDLIVFGAHLPGEYPKPSRSYVLRNEPKRWIFDTSAIAGLNQLGVVTDAVVVDFDHDGAGDIFVVGDWESPKVIRQTSGKWEVYTPKSLEKLRSWWRHCSIGDWNGDGRIDIVLGSFGENNKFHPTPDKPLQVYTEDFDANGKCDVVLAKSYRDKIVPTRGRECSSEQLPFIAEKFPTYHAFALASVDEILGPKIKKAYHREIHTLSHYVLWNTPDGWELQKLPVPTQIGLLRDVATVDINGDGVDDLIGIGNHFAAEVETTRYDANYGWVVLGSRDSHLRYIPPLDAGIFFKGDGRSLTVFKSPGGDVYLIALFNSDSSKEYRLITSTQVQ